MGRWCEGDCFSTEIGILIRLSASEDLNFMEMTMAKAKKRKAGRKAAPKRKTKAAAKKKVAMKKKAAPKRKATKRTATKKRKMTAKAPAKRKTAARRKAIAKPRGQAPIAAGDATVVPMPPPIVDSGSEENPPNAAAA